MRGISVTPGWTIRGDPAWSSLFKGGVSYLPLASALSTRPRSFLGGSSGSSGIGLATAKRFVDEGAYVFITGG